LFSDYNIGGMKSRFICRKNWKKWGNDGNYGEWERWEWCATPLFCLIIWAKWGRRRDEADARTGLVGEWWKKIISVFLLNV